MRRKVENNTNHFKNKIVKNKPVSHCLKSCAIFQVLQHYIENNIVLAYTADKIRCSKTRKS